jgi:hypothetical protein
MPAGKTRAAGYLRHEDCCIPWGKPFHLGANLNNHTCDFMTLHHWIAGIWVPPMKNMDIRAANPDPLHLDQHFIWLKLWARYLAKFDLSGFGHDGL